MSLVCMAIATYDVGMCTVLSTKAEKSSRINGVVGSQSNAKTVNALKNSSSDKIFTVLMIIFDYD